MDQYYEHGMFLAKTPSILRGGGGLEDEFSNRILSRNSSVGCSSRIYYHGSTEGVPFKWERQPGTPKNLPKEKALPPLSPPPALLGLGLPKPCIDLPEPKKGRIRFRFWKGRSKKVKERHGVYGSDKSSNFDGFSSDGECVQPSRNSSSSSSSSITSRNDSCTQSSRFHGGKEWSSHGCGPWNFSGIVVGVARRG